jgi:hypothetical protein
MVRVQDGIRRLVSRVAAFLLVLIPPALISLSVPAAAHQVTAEERREADLFVLGNAVFILYHELGHALIDLLSLPVLGREEDAADNLASIMMIPEQPDPMMDELVVAAADGWYLSNLWQQRNGNAEIAWWGEHSLDMQRFYSVVCLMYGSDPEGFADLASSVSLPAERRTACPSEYAQARTSWGRLLAPHMTPALARAGTSSRIRVDYVPPGPDHGYVAALLHESGLVEAVARDIGTNFRLPHNLTIRFRSCGQANAFYQSDEATVTLCYELLKFYDRLILDDIAVR